VIAELLHDLKQSALDTLAYLLFTAFVGWLFVPPEWLP
jgi:hypothetical protein